ncbi:MAG: hypothetical protein IRY99_25245 [Isosphaeraceae bacterium]|nr:hypothetical protein [Isosphaeraceae bacterium]
MRWIAGVLLGAAWLGIGCGPTAPTETDGGGKPGTIGGLRNGHSALADASALWIDRDGRCWLDADAPVVKLSDADGAASLAHKAFWIGKSLDEYRVGLDMLPPAARQPRARPRSARWIEAKNMAALVREMKDKYYNRARK